MINCSIERSQGETVRRALPICERRPPSMYASLRAVLAVVTVLLATSGCGLLYSETRDKQGQAAKEAWSKVDLTAQVAVPRKNEAALLAKQLELADTLAKAERDQLAWGLVLNGRAITDKRSGGADAGQPPRDASVAGVLQKAVDTRLQRFVQNASDVATWHTAQRKAADTTRALEKYQTEFQRFGLEMPSCDRIDSNDAKAPINDWIAAHTATPVTGTPSTQSVGPAMRATLTGALAACARQVTAMQALNSLALSAGQLKTARQDLIEATNELVARRSEGLNQRNAFQAASAAYDAGAAALATDPDGARRKVQAAAATLQTIANGLSSLQDAFSVHFVAEKKQQSLDSLLATVLTTPAGSMPAADSSKAAIALVLFPDLIDQAKSSLADAKKPNLLPLLLLKNLAQVRADAAARDIDTQVALVALRQAKLDWQTAGAYALLGASKLLSRAADVSHQPLTQVLQPVRDPQRDTIALLDKTDVWKAAALYLDDVGRLEAEASKTDYQINAIRYERTLDYAESNVAQWNTLITSSVDEMAQFGAAGIKKEDVIALLNTLTLLWIGAGVN